MLSIYGGYIINPIQIITNGILQRQVDINYRPHLHNKTKVDPIDPPTPREHQIHDIKRIINSGDVLTVKRKSTLGKALIAYHKTPYGKNLVKPWLLSKAMIHKPKQKPKIMMVMLFANGIFKDKLAPINFFMWMLTNYGVG